MSSLYFKLKIAAPIIAGIMAVITAASVIIFTLAALTSAEAFFKNKIDQVKDAYLKGWADVGYSLEGYLKINKPADKFSEYLISSIQSLSEDASQGKTGNVNEKKLVAVGWVYNKFFTKTFIEPKDIKVPVGSPPSVTYELKNIVDARKAKGDNINVFDLEAFDMIGGGLDNIMNTDFVAVYSKAVEKNKDKISAKEKEDNKKIYQDYAAKVQSDIMDLTLDLNKSMVKIMGKNYAIPGNNVWDKARTVYAKDTPDANLGNTNKKPEAFFNENDSSLTKIQTQEDFDSFCAYMNLYLSKYTNYINQTIPDEDKRKEVYSEFATIANKGGVKEKYSYIQYINVIKDRCNKAIKDNNDKITKDLATDTYKEDVKQIVKTLNLDNTDNVQKEYKRLLKAQEPTDSYEFHYLDLSKAKNVIKSGESGFLKAHTGSIYKASKNTIKDLNGNLIIAAVTRNDKANLLSQAIKDVQKYKEDSIKAIDKAIADYNKQLNDSSGNDLVDGISVSEIQNNLKQLRKERDELDSLKLSDNAGDYPIENAADVKKLINSSTDDHDKKDPNNLDMNDWKAAGGKTVTNLTKEDDAQLVKDDGGVVILDYKYTIEECVKLVARNFYANTVQAMANGTYRGMLGIFGFSNSNNNSSVHGVIKGHVINGKSYSGITTGYYGPGPGASAEEIAMEGAGNATASGKYPEIGMIAAPKEWAFGTYVEVAGLTGAQAKYNGVYTVEDRGGAITAVNGVQHIDIFTGHVGKEFPNKATADAECNLATSNNVTLTFGNQIQVDVSAGADGFANRCVTDKIPITAEEINTWIAKETGGNASKYQLNGKGAAFIEASNASGIDPVWLVALAGLESGWGSGAIGQSKNDWYSIGAFNSSPASSAYSYNSPEAGIIDGAVWIRKHYVDVGQDTMYKMLHGNPSHVYCTLDDEKTPNDNWQKQISDIMKNAPPVKNGTATISNSSNSTSNNSSNKSSSGSSAKKTNPHHDDKGVLTDWFSYFKEQNIFKNAQKYAQKWAKLCQDEGIKDDYNTAEGDNYANKIKDSVEAFCRENRAYTTLDAKKLENIIGGILNAESAFILNASTSGDYAKTPSGDSDDLYNFRNLAILYPSYNLQSSKFKYAMEKFPDDRLPKKVKDYEYDGHYVEGHSGKVGLGLVKFNEENYTAAQNEGYSLGDLRLSSIKNQVYLAGDRFIDCAKNERLGKKDIRFAILGYHIGKDEAIKLLGKYDNPKDYDELKKNFKAAPESGDNIYEDYINKVLTGSDSGTVSGYDDKSKAELDGEDLFYRNWKEAKRILTQIYNAIYQDNEPDGSGGGGTANGGALTLPDGGKASGDGIDYPPNLNIDINDFKARFSSLTPDEKRQLVVAYSEKFAGCPYVSGGKGPNVFDCSGLVWYVYNQVGVSEIGNYLTTFDYKTGYASYRIPFNAGSLSDYDNLKLGDAIICNNEGHVVIYIGKYDGVPYVINATKPGSYVLKQPLAWHTNKGIQGVYRFIKD